MYDLSWGDERSWRGNGGDAAIPPAPPDRAVTAAGLLLWEEHCVECSVPECYSVCRLYVARKDQKCARFVYGVFPNRNVQGLFPFGADILFRRWGKLEARSLGFPRMVPVAALRRYARWQRHIERAVNASSDLLQPVNPKRRLNGLQTYLRGKWFFRDGSGRDEVDAFYAKFYYPGSDELALQIELHQDRPVFRDVIRVRPGWNEHIVPVDAIQVEPNHPTRLLLTMSNEQSARLVFTWLDFVRFADRIAVAAAPRSLVEQSSIARPAAKVKCVAWDLDHTLWDGVIGDVGPENVVPNARALQLVKELDRRGIVQTIASKNTYEIAWAKVEELGLADYMLYPAIHWGPKSESLKAIATEFNFNVDTFALIDDSPFERAEVAAALPQVRVYDVAELETLLAQDEFDVPITEASLLRRLSYLAEAQRKRVSAVWNDDVEGFLRSCQLVLHISPPTKNERLRCLELLQRTNQLNLSTRSYDDAAFDALLGASEIECFALRCVDRFGDYGLVGFAAIDRSGETPVLRDFVLSCRVAQKMVEETFLWWYAAKLQRAGIERLHAAFTPTARNKPLRAALDSLPFRLVRDVDGVQTLELAFPEPVRVPDVIRIETS